MRRREWFLDELTCSVCGQAFDWFHQEGDAEPESAACEACVERAAREAERRAEEERLRREALAARAAEEERRRREDVTCLRCRTQASRWRGLCLDCFRPARLEANRRGWAALIAEGTAAPRSPGHGNPSSRPCGEPGCDRKATHRGICKLHADRRRRREAFLRRLEATQ